MKIKKKVTTVEEIEIEIPLPFYGKEGRYFYYVFAENQGVRVALHSNEGASMWNLSEYEFTSDNILELPPCTEQEFAEAFQKALYLISRNTPILTHAQYPMPTEEDFEPKDNGIAEAIMGEDLP